MRNQDGLIPIFNVTISSMKNSLLSFFLIIFMSCSGKYTPPVLTVPFSNGPPVPDYSRASSWAALPEMGDSADCVPKQSGHKDCQEKARADVFFIHPTSYLKRTEKSTGWNADISDSLINIETDKGSIKNQASAFNGTGRIYAPRYRQAFIYSYYEGGKENGKMALNLAYDDVQASFKYYLKNFNNGRPFIIASHSQGTTHAIRLLQEFVDGQPLSRQMVAAYLIGMDVYDTLFTVLTPCSNPDETNCYVTWRTYAVNYYPPQYVAPSRETVCTNPLTWTTGNEYASRELNKGGVLWNFDKVIENISDARVQDGVLRINEPRFRGRLFFNIKNYHIVDYNLFYFNIRENAENRVKMFEMINDR